MSTIRHHIRRGMELTSSTGQIETWRLKHFDENGWTGPDLQNLYVSNKYLSIFHSQYIIVTFIRDTFFC